MRLLIICMMAIAGCADDMRPHYRKEHEHNIVSYDTLYQYKLRWFCGDCRQWFNTVDLYRINYTDEPPKIANEKKKHEAPR